MANEEGKVAPGPALIPVSVCFALPGRQVVIELVVPAGTSLGEAITLSGIEAQFVEIQPGEQPTGIYGQRADRDTVLVAEDRVEIYRPLVTDPKEVRRERAQADAAAKVKSAGAKRRTPRHGD